MTFPDRHETEPTLPRTRRGDARQTRDTRNEIARFLVVGLLTVVIDFIGYRAMLAAGLDVSWSKAIGFVTGTVFAYFANRRFTFANPQTKHRSALRFTVLYATTLAINVGVNRLALMAAHSIVPDGVAVPFAFMCATALSATLNFAGMKFFVFHARD